MLCVVCQIVRLEGRQEKYCSKVCERRGWKIDNRQKILDGKRRYREANKEKIQAYMKEYKARVPHVSESIAVKLKKEYSCLRCEKTERLEVHHIKHQDLGGGRNDLNNLVVLCKPCHALWHKMFPKEYWEYGMVI